MLLRRDNRQTGKCICYDGDTKEPLGREGKEGVLSRRFLARVGTLIETGFIIEIETETQCGE